MPSVRQKEDKPRLNAAGGGEASGFQILDEKLQVRVAAMALSVVLGAYRFADDGDVELLEAHAPPSESPGGVLQIGKKTLCMVIADNLEWFSVQAGAELGHSRDNGNLRHKAAHHSAMSSFNPQAPLPAPIMDLRRKVLANPGLHINYPYGLTFRRKWAKMPEPLYTGVTLRAFFYGAGDAGDTGVSLHYYDYVAKPYSHVAVRVNVDKVTVSHFFTPVRESTKKLSLKYPAYYSVALRITDHKYVTGYLNNEELTVLDVDDISASADWDLAVFSRTQNHVLISFHISDELQTSFPSGGLKQQYALEGDFHLPTGSYSVYTLVFTGPSHEVLLLFSQPSGVDLETNFDGPTLQDGEEFTFFIRNAPKGWLIHASFVNTAKVVQRTGYNTFIAPKFSDDCCYIKKVYSECGPQK
ncbi:uncharacterized protein LOC144103279 [Amblyomma americanum]